MDTKFRAIRATAENVWVDHCHAQSGINWTYVHSLPVFICMAGFEGAVNIEYPFTHYGTILLELSRDALPSEIADLCGCTIADAKDAIRDTIALIVRDMDFCEVNPSC